MSESADSDHSSPSDQRNLIELLPNELLSKIVDNLCLTYTDLCRISCVSKRFNQIIVKNNELWKQKFVQKWPKLCRNNTRRFDTSTVADWHRMVVDRHLIGCHLRKEVSKLSETHYSDEELSNDSFISFLSYNKKTNDSSVCELSPNLLNLFEINELEMLLNDGFDHKNLTLKYYALKVIRFLRHESLKHQWIQYLESGVESRDLFFGSLLISSWFQLNQTLNEDHFRKQLELISQLTVDEIALNYEMNSILKLNSGKCLSDSEANDLMESKWSPKDCKQILLCLNEVLFHQLKFRPNDDNYYDMNNSFIDKVIDNRLGIPITYCILYQTIAAKLGVKTFGVNFPHHFILKWKQFDNSNEANAYTYIDVYESGRLLTANSHLFHNYNLSDIECLGVCSTRDVFCRMCRNLIEIGRQQEISSEGLLCLRNALELLCILSPEDTESRLLLSRVYLHLNINLEEVNEMLQKISERDPNSIGVVMFLRQSVVSQLSAKRNNNANNSRKNGVKRRKQNNDINYSIGMIMCHKKYNYTCVIYGWDSKCAASRDWIYQMGVHNLPNKDRQPFYNVLVEDGSTRYAAQENLEPASDPIEIKHPEIGKYFNEFGKTHYIPNQQKASEYPDDESALNEYLSQLKH